MRNSRWARWTGVAVIGMVLALAILNSSVTQTAQYSNPERIKPADVDSARIIGADREPGNWMSHGRDYGEQRFSPLKEVNDQNIGSLGLAWYYGLDTDRGQESTPIVVDGVMYVTSAWSKVFALDAATGALLCPICAIRRPWRTIAGSISCSGEVCVRSAWSHSPGSFRAKTPRTFAPT
jgi:glucose dehydrogenase